MKKIFLMRHSIPEKGDMPNEQIPLSEEGKALAVSKRNIFSNVDRCFSSPYRRAMEQNTELRNKTANALFLDL